VAKDIIYISSSFTTGTVIAALALSFSPAAMPAWDIGAAGMIAAGAALAVFAAVGRSRIAATPAFVALGVCCYATAVAGGVSRCADVGDWEPARAAAGRLRDAIAALPLRGEHSAPLLTALLTGNREGLSREITAAFRASGASHILALSGLHLGFLYGILRVTLSPMGRSRPAGVIRSVITVAASAFYALMTGCPPSIVRALLFIVLNELARHSPGRRKDPLAILCTALVIQLVITPTVITTVGFQLSYLAMLGIFILFPIMQAWYPASGNDQIDRLDPVRKIWNSAAMTLSCQLFTAPLVWKKFGSIPSHFLLTNLLALPLTELLILSGVAALVTDAAGICPGIIIKSVDTLAHALIFILQVISSM